MFSVSFSELFIILIVSIFVLDPKDLKFVLKKFSSFRKNAQDFRNLKFLKELEIFEEEIKSSLDFKDELEKQIKKDFLTEELKNYLEIDDMKYILGDDGNYHRAFNVKELHQEIQSTTNQPNPGKLLKKECDDGGSDET